jgi:hypothetical protein
LSSRNRQKLAKHDRTIPLEGTLAFTMSLSTLKNSIALKAFAFCLFFRAYPSFGYGDYGNYEKYGNQGDYGGGSKSGQGGGSAAGGGGGGGGGGGDGRLGFSIPCSKDIVEFQACAIIDFDGFDDDPNDVTSINFKALELSFKNAYNRLSNELCDDDFREVVWATIEPDEYGDYLIRRGGNTFSLRFTIVGRCRGCDPNSVDLFSPPDMRARRDLQGKRIVQQENSQLMRKKARRPNAQKESKQSEQAVESLGALNSQLLRDKARHPNAQKQHRQRPQGGNGGGIGSPINGELPPLVLPLDLNGNVETVSGSKSSLADPNNSRQRQPNDSGRTRPNSQEQQDSDQDTENASEVTLPLLVLPTDSNEDSASTQTAGNSPGGELPLLILPADPNDQAVSGNTNPDGNPQIDFGNDSLRVGPRDGNPNSQSTQANAAGRTGTGNGSPGRGKRERPGKNPSDQKGRGETGNAGGGDPRYSRPEGVSGTGTRDGDSARENRNGRPKPQIDDIKRGPRDRFPGVGQNHNGRTVEVGGSVAQDTTRGNGNDRRPNQSKETLDSGTRPKRSRQKPSNQDVARGPKLKFPKSDNGRARKPSDESYSNQRNKPIQRNPSGGNGNGNDDLGRGYEKGRLDGRNQNDGQGSGYSDPSRGYGKSYHDTGKGYKRKHGRSGKGKGRKKGDYFTSKSKSKQKSKKKKSSKSSKSDDYESDDYFSHHHHPTDERPYSESNDSPYHPSHDEPYYPTDDYPYPPTDDYFQNPTDERPQNGFCECNSQTPEYRAPTEEEFRVSYDQVIKEFRAPRGAHRREAVIVDYVIRVAECENLQCPSSDVEVFSRMIVLCLLGARKEISEFERRVVEDAFVDVYNGLQTNRCDFPFFQKVTSADIMMAGDPADPKNFIYIFRITGTCRGDGCATEVGLFADPNTARTRLHLDDPRKARRMTQNKTAVDFMMLAEQDTPEETFDPFRVEGSFGWVGDLDMLSDPQRLQRRLNWDTFAKENPQEQGCTCPRFDPEIGPPLASDFEIQLTTAIQDLQDRGIILNIRAIDCVEELGDGGLTFEPTFQPLTPEPTGTFEPTQTWGPTMSGTAPPTTTAAPSTAQPPSINNSPTSRTQVPTTSAAPSSSAAPSFSPSVSHEPSTRTSAPTITAEPTISPAPTADSLEPTVSPQPTRSSSPSTGPSVSLKPSVGPSRSQRPSIGPTSSAQPSTTTDPPTVSRAPSSPPTTSRHPSLSPTSTPSTSQQPSTGIPTVSQQPSRSQSPSSGPSNPPSVSSRPTISNAPSEQPTVSTRPSAMPSDMPSFSPTVSAQPSVTFSPTTLAPSISNPPSDSPGPSNRPSPTPTISSQPSVTASDPPSILPSTPPVSPMPSSSALPSAAPSISPAPTISANPTNSPSITPQPTLILNLGRKKTTTR